MKKYLFLIFSLLSFLLTFTSIAQQYQWAYSISNAGFDYRTRMAVDASGNTYFCGQIVNTVDFDPDTGVYNLTSNGSVDMFFAKYNKDGKLLFAKRIGNTASDVGYAIDVDSMENIYVTGSFRGTTDFDPDTSTLFLTSNGFSDIFIAKYDSGGSIQWANSFGDSDDDIGYSVEVDRIGNVYICGHFFYTVDFNPDSTIANNLTSVGYNDIFFAKYDNNGNYLWAKGIGSSDDDRCYSINVDKLGNVFLAGFFTGTADFDPNAGIMNLSVNGGDDLFFAKYDNNGNYLWAKKIGSSGNDYCNKIVTDFMGNVYITGYFWGTADFDPDTGTANLTAQFWDVFFAKYDSDGNLDWAKKFGSSSSDNGNDIAVDSLGNVYIIGFFGGSTDFDPGPRTANLNTNGDLDVFIARYDNCGNYFWAQNFGSTNADFGLSIAINNENIYITGSIAGTTDFDPGPGVANIYPLDLAAMFIAKYSDVYCTLLKQTIFDTLLIAINDTIQFYDTTFITINDTVAVYDTNFVTVTDTSYITINDTNFVNDTIPIYDTAFVTITDTTYITINDTNFVNDTIPVYDTTFVTVTDTTYLTVNDTNFVNIYDSIAVTDTLIIDVNTGLIPPDNLNTIKVYPNPAKTHITIDNGNYNLLNGYTLKIMNSLSQIVFQSVINQQQFYIDLSGWTGNGTYFVNIIDPQNNTIDIRKIILE